jgi:diaminopimelate epimerase
MCGNGGRCIVAFAKYLSLIDSECIFNAIDGLHKAKIDDRLKVELKMKDVFDIDDSSDDLVLDTGSPHYIKLVKDIQALNVPTEGAKIRYSEKFKKDGINVNFVEIIDNELHIRTYERGVEDETLSCGTGVTAAAIAVNRTNLIDSNHIFIKAQGGHLEVKFNKSTEGYDNIWLIGLTQQVFKGEILC